MWASYLQTQRQRGWGGTGAEAHDCEYSEGNDSSWASALSGTFCAASVIASTWGSWLFLHRSAKSIPRRSSSACVLTYTPRCCQWGKSSALHTRTKGIPRSDHRKLSNGIFQGHALARG